jgi:hypothetical protein
MIVRELNHELVLQFEEKLRSLLQAQDKEWLIYHIPVSCGGR